MEELCKAFGQVKNQPTAIIAKTFKGRGITGLYARVSFHPPPRDWALRLTEEGGFRRRASESPRRGLSQPLASSAECTQSREGGA